MNPLNNTANRRQIEHVAKNDMFHLMLKEKELLK